jgi:hypothetical protein
LQSMALQNSKTLDQVGETDKHEQPVQKAKSTRKKSNLILNQNHLQCSMLGRESLFSTSAGKVHRRIPKPEQTTVQQDQSDPAISTLTVPLSICESISPNDDDEKSSPNGPLPTFVDSSVPEPIPTSSSSSESDKDSESSNEEPLVQIARPDDDMVGLSSSIRSHLRRFSRRFEGLIDLKFDRDSDEDDDENSEEGKNIIAAREKRRLSVANIMCTTRKAKAEAEQAVLNNILASINPKLAAKIRKGLQLREAKRRAMLRQKFLRKKRQLGPLTPEQLKQIGDYFSSTPLTELFSESGDSSDDTNSRFLEPIVSESDCEFESESEQTAMDTINEIADIEVGDEDENLEIETLEKPNQKANPKPTVSYQEVRDTRASQFRKSFARTSKFDIDNTVTFKQQHDDDSISPPIDLDLLQITPVRTARTNQDSTTSMGVLLDNPHIWEQMTDTLSSMCDQIDLDAQLLMMQPVSLSTRRSGGQLWANESVHSTRPNSAIVNLIRATTPSGAVVQPLSSQHQTSSGTVTPIPTTTRAEETVVLVRQTASSSAELQLQIAQVATSFCCDIMTAALSSVSKKIRLQRLPAPRNSLIVKISPVSLSRKLGSSPVSSESQVSNSVARRATVNLAEAFSRIFDEPLRRIFEDDSLDYHSEQASECHDFSFETGNDKDDNDDNDLFGLLGAMKITDTPKYDPMKVSRNNNADRYLDSTKKDVVFEKYLRQANPATNRERRIAYGQQQTRQLLSHVSKSPGSSLDKKKPEMPPPSRVAFGVKGKKMIDRPAVIISDEQQQPPLGHDVPESDYDSSRLEMIQNGRRLWSPHPPPSLSLQVQCLSPPLFSDSHSLNSTAFQRNADRFMQSCTSEGTDFEEFEVELQHPFLVSNQILDGSSSSSVNNNSSSNNDSSLYPLIDSLRFDPMDRLSAFSPMTTSIPQPQPVETYLNPLLDDRKALPAYSDGDRILIPNLGDPMDKCVGSSMLPTAPSNNFNNHNNRDDDLAVGRAADKRDPVILVSLASPKPSMMSPLQRKRLLKTSLDSLMSTSVERRRHDDNDNNNIFNNSNDHDNNDNNDNDNDGVLALHATKPALKSHRYEY